MSRKKEKLIKWLDTLVDNCKDKMNTPECDYDCSESHQQIKELIQNQPEVDEKFVETALERLNNCCQIGSCSGRDSEWGELDREKAEKALRQIFKEAGIKIKED